MKINILSPTLFICLLSVGLAGCSAGNGGTTTGNPYTADDSASGAVAKVLGGALSETSSSGTLAMQQLRTHVHSLFPDIWRQLQIMPSAVASVTCPTFNTPQGSGCDASGSTLWLTFSSCSRGSGSAEWNGVFSLTTSSGSAACQSFPNPGANGDLYRQFVQADGSSTPGVASITANGRTFYLDESTANLNNFNSDTIPYVYGSGYGVKVGFDASGSRDAVTVGEYEYSPGLFSHSITGSVTISDTGSSQTVTGGSITTYHNYLRVIGTSTFSNLVHENTCCLPVSGSITTTFAAGSKSPTVIGDLMVGKSETLTFTGCGTGTLQGYDGAVQNVSFTRCY